MSIRGIWDQNRRILEVGHAQKLLPNVVLSLNFRMSPVRCTVTATQRQQVVSVYPWRWVAMTPETRGYHLFPGKEVSLAMETCYANNERLICKVVARGREIRTSLCSLWQGRFKKRSSRLMLSFYNHAVLLRTLASFLNKMIVPRRIFPLGWGRRS